jgi:hypothetical protein
MARLERAVRGLTDPPASESGLGPIAYLPTCELSVTGPELSLRSYILCGTAKGRILVNIGIIGAGNIGATAARLFAGAGHRVAVSNSRGPETLRDLVSEMGESARAMTVDEAADFGKVVLLAVPWSRCEEGLPSAGLLVDKIVIDAINPYTPDFRIEDLGDDTSSEVSPAVCQVRVSSRPSTPCITRGSGTKETRVCRPRIGSPSSSPAMTPRRKPSSHG